MESIPKINVSVGNYIHEGQEYTNKKVFVF